VLALNQVSLFEGRWRRVHRL